MRESLRLLRRASAIARACRRRRTARPCSCSDGCRARRCRRRIRAPARANRSPSPVASTTTGASTARRPALLSNTAPRTAPSRHRLGAPGVEDQLGTLLSSTHFLRGDFSHSGSMVGDQVTTPWKAAVRCAQWAASAGVASSPIRSRGGPATAPRAGGRGTPRRSRGSPACPPSRSSGRSRSPARRWKGRPGGCSRSSSMRRAPIRAAAKAAAMPAGPPPTTSTSHSACTGISRAGSANAVPAAPYGTRRVVAGPCAGCRSGRTTARRPKGRDRVRS